MNHKKYFILMILCLFTCLSQNGWTQDDMEFVDNSVFTNPTRPAAIFKHDLHNDKAGINDCAICHHVYDESGQLLPDESSEDKSCSDCHAMESIGNQPGLMKAFHLNCKGCHETQNQGPLMCGECHKR